MKVKARKWLYEDKQITIRYTFIYPITEEEVRTVIHEAGKLTPYRDKRMYHNGYFEVEEKEENK